MEYYKIVKSIRMQLGWSQEKFANEIGVSFATVNRWEKQRCKPSRIAMNAIKALCEEHKIDYKQFEENTIISLDETLVLYHGSKAGIKGPIMPVSRDRCDFGKGFYMGTEMIQPLTLICNYPHAKLYTLQVNLSGLKIYNVEVGLEWALLVAFNRGKMDDIKGSAIYKKYENMIKSCDMIVGYIANDRMFVVLDRFFSGEITDMALIHSLSALKLGKQYAALTQKACRQIQIIEEKVLSKKDRDELRKESEKNRTKGIKVAEEVCIQYRREGRFFDEILKEGE